MDSFVSEFVGQTFSSIEPLGTGNNLVTNDGQLNMAEYLQFLPPMASPGISLKFNSFSEARAFVDQQRPVKEVITDPSYPKYEEQQKPWAQATMAALYNMEGVEDGAKLLKQWETMMAQNSTNIELVAWKLLKGIMTYHNLEGKLEPSNAETQKARDFDNFAEHMKCILEILADKKTLCRHLATDHWTTAFIDAPELHALRVANNRKINDSKKAKADAGNAIIKHMQTAVENSNAGVDTVIELAEVHSLLGDVPKTNLRNKDEGDEDSATGRTAAAGIGKKSTRSKQTPKSKKPSRKRKFSDDDKDADSSYSEPRSAARTPVDSPPPSNNENENAGTFLSQSPNNMVDAADNNAYRQNLDHVPSNDRAELAELNGTVQETTQNAATYGNTPQGFQRVLRRRSLQRFRSQDGDIAMENTGATHEASIFADSDDEHDSPGTSHPPRRANNSMAEFIRTTSSHEQQDSPWYHGYGSPTHVDPTGEHTVDPNFLTITSERDRLASRTLRPEDLIHLNNHYL